MKAVYAFVGAFFLFRRLNGVLRTAWAFLLLGLGFAIAGYFTELAAHSWAGWSCLALGGIISLLDLLLRRTNRESTAIFFTGFTMALLGAALLFALMLVVALIVYIARSCVDGWSLAYALRLLHLIMLYGVLFLVLGIPAAIRYMDDRQITSPSPQE